MSERNVLLRTSRGLPGDCDTCTGYTESYVLAWHSETVNLFTEDAQKPVKGCAFTTSGIKEPLLEVDATK